MLLATGCHDGNFRIWDIAKGQPVQTIPAHIAMNQPSPIYSIAWSPDDKQLLTASYDRSMKLWNAADGKRIREVGAGEIVVVKASGARNSKLQTSNSRETPITKLQ